MANQVFVDFIMRGLEGFAEASKQIRALEQATKGLGSAGDGIEKTAKGLKSVGDEAVRIEKAILAQAQAQARLSNAQGDTAKAVKTLENALASVTKGSIAAIRAETQLVGLQAQLANSAGKADTALLREAQALARIQQQLGNSGGAIAILDNALKKVSNPNSLAAFRAQLQKTYLDTGYKNSPLVGTLQQINSQFDKFLPIIGSVSPRLAQFVGIAQKAAGAFQTTGEATKSSTTGASTFLEAIKRAGQAVADFGKDQGGTASFTDALLNLSKIASNVGDRIRAVFARIKEAAANAFSNLKQGKNPFADLFSGSKGAQSATADTAKIAANLGEVESAATGAAEAVGEIGAAGTVATVAVAGVAAALVALAVGVGIVGGIAAGLKQIGEDGIAANRQLEALRLGIASVINGVGTISKDGIELKGADAFNAALKLANDQVSKIKEEAAGLGLPVQEAAEGLQTAIGPLTQFGLGLDDARKTTLNILVAMQALNIPLREAGQEARAILQGQTDRTARLNQILRITKEELAVAKQRGDIQQLLNERLAGFAAGGAAFAQSFDGSIARAQARIKAFEGGVTEGLFNTIRDRLNSALEGIAKQGSITQTFSGLADTLTNIFNRAAEFVAPLIDGIVNGVKLISDFLGQNQQSVDRIIEAIAIIVEQVVGIGLDLLKTIGISGDWGASLDSVSKILKVVAVVIAEVREGIFLVRSAVVAVGAAIGFALLSPLEIALRAIAAITSVIPGVGSVARGISDVVDNALVSLAASAKNNGKAVVDTVQNFGKAGSDAIKRIDEASARFAAKRKADADKSKVDTTGLTFTGKPQPDDKEKKSQKASAANTEASLKQLREAEFALRKAFADREIALAKAETETQNRILDQQLEDRQISIASFYAEKAKLVEQDRQREIKAINDSIAAERAKLEEISAAEQRQFASESAKPAKQRKAGETDKIRTDAEVERLKTLAKIVDLETKLNEAELKGDAQAAQNTRSRIKALRELQGQVAGVSIDLARATGDDLNAALAEIDQKFSETLRTFIANFGEKSAEVEKLLKLIGLQKQGATAQLKINFEVPNASRDFAESDVQRQVTAGLLTEAQARQRLLDIQRAYATDTLPLIRQQIEELEKLAKAEIAASPTGQESAQTRGKILDLQKREQDVLRGAIDPFFAEIKRGFTSDLKGSVEQFLLFSKGGFEDLKDLALGFVDSLKRAIAKVLSEQIEKKFIDPFVNKIFGFLGLGGGTDPAQLANTVATDANTAAIVGLTSAVSANGISGQFNIGGDGGGGFSLPNLGDTSAQQGDAAGAAVSAPGGALNNFFDKVKSGFEKFANGLKSVATGIGNGIKSVFAAIVGGISSAVGAIFGGGAAAAGGGGAAGGFAEGGYTGDGGKYQPAGIVHAGEFVQPASVVNRWGVGFMEAMRVGAVQPQHFNFNESLLAGFSPRRSSFLAEGGMPLASPSSGASGSSGGASSIRNVVLFNDSDVAAALASAEGEKVVFTHLQRRKNEIKQLLGLKS